MVQPHLRKIRIFVSLVFFIALLFLFFGINSNPFNSVANTLLYFQFLSSVLRFMALFFSITAMGFIVVILLTVVFGRVYCSGICPLGTLQDIIIAISRRLKPKRKRRFLFTSNRKRILRYGILAAMIIFWLAGSLFLVNLLDPYSNFGKITVSLFQPIYVWLHNALVFTLESFDVFAIRPLSLHALPLDVVIISAAILLVIVVMAAARGRLFCNTICPVGSILGLVGSKPLFQIKFNEDACTFCTKCEWVCKAECLDSKNQKVDHSRCINCFNCLESCPQGGITYSFEPVGGKKQAEPQQAKNKRQFLLMLFSGLLSLPLFSKYAGAELGRGGQGQQRQRQRDAGRQRGMGSAGMIPIENQRSVTPPGSLSHDHFTKHCIACYLCVSACPTKVIVPAFYAYGLKGFMQPTLDFNRSFCNYDCVKCSEVCPTGAITRQLPEEKQLVQMGVVRFLVESCVVKVDHTDCGACSEHCPTKAVQMVPWRDGLFIPQIRPSLCVGCGACEFACPTEPYKAIYVDGRVVHQKAKALIDDEGPREDDADDFPF
jgi:ferredoxin-type protein NapF